MTNEQRYNQLRGYTTLAEYDAAIERETNGTHVVPGDEYNEFSALPCGMCGSKLGGDRHQAWLCRGESIRDWPELAICTDCIQLVANAETPEDLEL